MGKKKKRNEWSCGPKSSFLDLQWAKRVSVVWEFMIVTFIGLSGCMNLDAPKQMSMLIDKAKTTNTKTINKLFKAFIFFTGLWLLCVCIIQPFEIHEPFIYNHTFFNRCWQTWIRSINITNLIRFSSDI